MTRLERLILLGIAAASAPAFAQMVCTKQPVEPIIVRDGGYAELLPDLVLQCTGGTPTPAGQPVPMVQFFSDITVQAFGRRNDIVVLVDEPAPVAQTPCMLIQSSCPILGTGTGVGTYSGGANRPNVFRAVGGAFPNEVFFRVPIDPPGQGTRTLRFTNLRANVSSGGDDINICTNLAPPCGAGPPPNYTLLATVDTSNLDEPENPEDAAIHDVVVTGSRITSFTVHIGEHIPNAFKMRSIVGSGDAQQNVPGSPPIYETGFRNLSFSGNFSTVGLASTGTRLLLALYFLPSGVTITVPTSISFGPLGLSTMRLINTDANGAGPYQEATTGTRTPDANGTLMAVYEFTKTSPTAIESFDVPITINYGPSAPATLLQLIGNGSFAPLFAAGQIELAPRFDSSGFNPEAIIDAPGPLTITTAPILPAATLGSAYSKHIFATGGTGPPYVFSIVGAAPAGLTLRAEGFGAGFLEGTPLVSGTSNFTVKVTDGANASVTQVFTLTVAPGPPNSALQISSLLLNFTAPQGGAPPPIQSLTIQSTLPPPTSLTIAPDGGNVNTPAPAWLNVSFQDTGSPYRITVSANQGALAAGTYNARILIGVVGSANPPLVVNVTLTVAAAAPQLSVSPDLLEFTAKITTPGLLSQTVQLSNTGGGVPIAFTAAVVNQSPWIKSITPAQGQAGNNPTPVRVDIDTTGLPLGFHRDIIRFTWLGNTLDLPVTVFIAPTGARLQLSRTGVYFRSNAGSVNLQTRQVRILNLDQSSAITWTATVLSSSEWLSISSSSGVSTLTDPSSINLGVKPEATNLPTGPSYALVRIDAPNTIDAPQYIVGVLDIQTGTVTSGLDFDEAGAVLTAMTGSAQPVSRVFKISTGSSAPVAFTASVASASGAGIFSISPASGAATSTATTPFTVSANPTGLGAGVYRAEIPVASAQGVQTLAVTLIVADAAGGGDSLGAGARAAGCVRSGLVATQIGLPNSFSVPAGWPTTLVVDLRDNCATQVLNGTVVASFSNGDPPLTLAGDGFSGTYSATWQPVALVNPMTITIYGRTSSLPDAVIPLTGAIIPNAVPALFRNGTVHNLDPKLGGPLSPGLVAQVYGANLATVTEGTPVVPLPTEYKGTKVLVGPYEAPIYFVSPGQLNIQVPSQLSPNLPYNIVVSANGALTVPDTINLVPVVPGVAVYSDGKAIAQHNDFAAHPPYPFVVTAADPAKRDEFLIVYLVGLGATNPPVVAGAASPGAEPLGRPVVPVTMTLGGLPVNAPFIGLTPFAVGLFQISFQVPSNAPLNTPLDLVVTQGGLTANVATITIAP